jgi:hypothetical protein
MEIYQVGVDVLQDYELKEVTEDPRWSWFAYFYEDGGYDGGGEGVAYNKEDNLLYWKDLSHCSCYGPMDGWATDCTKFTVDEFLSTKVSIYDEDARRELKEIVKKLCKDEKVFDENFDFLF